MSSKQHPEALNTAGSDSLLRRMSELTVEALLQALPRTPVS